MGVKVEKIKIWVEKTLEYFEFLGGSSFSKTSLSKEVWLKATPSDTSRHFRVTLTFEEIADAKQSHQEVQND
jgi:hypothetical protein